MPKRLFPVLLAAALGLAVATSALGVGPAARKEKVDERLSRLHDRIAQAREREDVLTAQIRSATSDIRDLEQQVGDVSRRLEPLEHDLALHQEQLGRLNTLFRLQTRRLQFLRRQYRLAVERLNQLLVAIYESDEPDSISAVLVSTSLGDLLDRLELTRERALVRPGREAAGRVGAARGLEEHAGRGGFAPAGERRAGGEDPVGPVD